VFEQSCVQNVLLTRLPIVFNFSFATIGWVRDFDSFGVEEEAESLRDKFDGWGSGLETFKFCYVGSLERVDSFNSTFINRCHFLKSELALRVLSLSQ
jgi:hypothetical protein